MKYGNVRIHPEGFAGSRAGFTDYDAFGAGFIARDTWSGNLDAPDFMPQGSVRASGTTKDYARMSLANRNVLTGHQSVGVLHD